MTEEAQRQARAERRWWRAHRDAKQLFDDELREARRILQGAPKHEVYGHIAGVAVRRMLLPKTRCHVYYAIFETERVVRILSIWGATRGEDPKLR